MTFSVHGLSCNNPERKVKMMERFSKVGVTVNWAKAIPDNDAAKSCMLGHLAMIQDFLLTEKDFGIMCEDDIHIRKNFQADIIVAINAYQRLKLDVLLLGYLTNYKPVTTTIHPAHNFVEQPFAILSVHDQIWGSMCYLIDRKNALRALELFRDPACVKGPFSADWTITKMGNRACIYPMLAVEEGDTSTTHVGQRNFHRDCHATNFNKEEYF